MTQLVSGSYELTSFRSYANNCRLEMPILHANPAGQFLEDLTGAEALTADLKGAIMAILTGMESRRWTISELATRLRKAELKCSDPAIIGALTELELQISMCHWLPWFLTENASEWALIPRCALFALLSNIRKLPGATSESLSDEQKAVLLVVIGHRRKGGVSRTRIENILQLNASQCLEDLCAKELIYASLEKELNWWKPTPAALLALGLRSTADIPELKELEQWFDSTKAYGPTDKQRGELDPILEKARISRYRRRRRELKRRSSAPQPPPTLDATQVQ